MEAIEFVIKYPGYLQEIRDVVKTELFPILDELAQIDPHVDTADDFSSPRRWKLNT